MDFTVTTTAPLPGPFAGMSINGRSCHLVDEQVGLRDGGLLLHFDGEFATLPDLVRSTLTGRNFGWLPRESTSAVAHIARLSHSAPYMHNGQFSTLAGVIDLYRQTSTLARAHTLRNGAKELQSIALRAEDVAPLVTFLRFLNEDYQ